MAAIPTGPTVRFNNGPPIEVESFSFGSPPDKAWAFAERTIVLQLEFYDEAQNARIDRLNDYIADDSEPETCPECGYDLYDDDL